MFAPSASLSLNCVASSLRSMNATIFYACSLAKNPAGFEEIRDRVWRLRRQVLDHRTNFEAGNFGALFRR